MQRVQFLLANFRYENFSKGKRRNVAVIDDSHVKSSPRFRIVSNLSHRECIVVVCSLCDNTGMLPPVYNKRAIFDESQEMMKLHVDGAKDTALLASRSPILFARPSPVHALHLATSYCSIVTNRGDIVVFDENWMVRELSPKEEYYRRYFILFSQITNHHIDQN